MKTKVVQILFVFLSTVLAAAFQDMLPVFGGAKPPLLLAITLYWAISEPTKSARGQRKTEKQNSLAVRWVFSAFIAGAFEDALSEFPLGCATGFFILAGAMARLFLPVAQTLSPIALGLVSLMVAAPFHEIWLSVWGVAGDDPTVLVRFFASALPAAPTGVLLFVILPCAERIAGFSGTDTREEIA